MRRSVKNVGAAMIAALFILAGCSSSGGQYIDGIYEGSAQGAKSEIKVSVEVKGEKISKIEIVEHGETQSIVDAAIETTIPEIIKEQSTEDIDVISGASKSSEAVVQAVESALSNAKK
ncbi:FMN-binding protein [Paenibacillus lentus]|uniref:FMN-binding protein n=1 Tax=Paenibacillus lentus TaxID=1338368 RepID=A0A3Q8S4Z8_9BACL|nr:FMN-binding protein [Paenibacillus lentus]AZK46819.1 FMN-binding protein [Paenibacillus lentus]